MKQPIIKIPKKGKDITSRKIEDFLVYTKYNNLKIFGEASGETEFTSFGQVNKYEYRHNLGYKPMVFGFYTGCYSITSDAVLTEDNWYPMNSKEESFQPFNSINGAFEYNDIANSGTPSSSSGDNDSTEYITVFHYHTDWWPGTTDHLPVTSKYKVFILATPENGAWF